LIDHPFNKINNEKLRKPFLLLLLLTVGLMVALNAINAPLATQAAPLGIISYELAGTVAVVREILESWDHGTKLHAAFGLGLDYLFLLAYSTTIGLGCILAKGVLNSRSWPLASLAIPLAWGLWLAAMLDAVENTSLTLMLFGVLIPPLPEIAYWCAVIKFALVFAGLIYVFYAGAIRLVIKA